jgi:hypothetical protein
MPYIMAVTLIYTGVLTPCEASVPTQTNEEQQVNQSGTPQVSQEQKQATPPTMPETVTIVFDQNYDKVIFDHIMRTAPHVGSEGAATITKCILNQSSKYQVEPFLVTALFTQESGFNMAAKSRTGAVGIAQIQPDTAKLLGINPYDLEQNIEGGIRYFADQLTAFAHYGGDETLMRAVAAYNAGPNMIIKYQGVPPYPETANHVKRVGAIFRQLRLDYDCITWRAG